MTDCSGGWAFWFRWHKNSTPDILRSLLLLLIVGPIRTVSADYSLVRISDYQVQEEPITCFGPLPPFELPRFYRRTAYRDDVYDANTFTLQQLCAKAGGNPASQNVGGICDASTDEVWFNGPRYRLLDVHTEENDRGDALHRSYHSPLETLRVKLYCQMRCVCTRHLSADVSRQPPPRPWGALGADRGKRCNGFVKIQLEDLGWSNKDRFSIRDSSNSLRISIKQRFQHWATLPGRALPTRWYRSCVGIAAESEIVCDARDPELTYFPFALPFPLTRDDFPTDQSICANALSGGNRNANAGGYCHRSEPQPDVWFSDEVTPRLEWTWESPRQSAAVRFYCWTRCRCAHATTAPRSRPMNLLWYYFSRTQTMLNIDPKEAHSLLQTAQEKTPRTLRGVPWRFMSRSFVNYDDQGDLYLSFDDLSTKAIPPLLLADTNGTVSPWPSRLLPILDNEPSNLYNLPSQLPANQQPLGLEQCGKTCYGMSDCASTITSTEQSSTCHCVLATSQLQKLFNLDAVFPAPGVCLSAVAMTAMTQLVVKQHQNQRVAQSQGLAGTVSGSLLGRDLGRRRDEEGGELVCLCNATLATVECCDSKTGILDF